MHSTVFDQERLDALEKWARRVVRQGTHKGYESRRAPREVMNAEIELIPLQEDTFRPQPENSILCVGKDVSSIGFGVVCNQRLDGDLYFVRVSGMEGVYLVRRARERNIHGAVREYGFMLLDRYESFRELYET